MKITVANKYLESKTKFKPLQTTLIIKNCSSILLKCNFDVTFQKKRDSNTPLRKPKKLQIKFLADKFRTTFNSEILLPHSQSEAVSIKLKKKRAFACCCLMSVWVWIVVSYVIRSPYTVGFWGQVAKDKDETSEIGINRVLKWHCDELRHNLCASLTIIMIMRARRVSWAWLVA